ncbi:hypothetical protein GO730_30785 [Spirosoma sp. HMF3257]|uniref:HTH luxR-type domain-containing protein n=1 Tax=Spirosoma telluris TaxID=2183553 RepID=A0A327NQA9_9BACT|nr:hypothetical protein [Spirosoma telluris]RAI77452.1 hypothetical protein HMF3257_30690 [Spirosoma telluris]
MNKDVYQATLNNFRETDNIYKRVVKLSERFFEEDILANTSNFVREAEGLLERVKGTDAVMGIFNHKTWQPIVEVGADKFWGEIPGSKEDRIKIILSYLEKEYENFPVDSVKWQINVLNEIPYDQRVNFKFHHCGIRYKRGDGTRICIFSQGMPFQYDKDRNFTYTFNYVQNISYLLKKDFHSYWIRMSYGVKNEFVRTYHSATGEYASRDLLSSREKEILTCIADDLDTKEIADRLFISPNTVGNHRSNMIERLGARDTTALVQLAKMAGMI